MPPWEGDPSWTHVLATVTHLHGGSGGLGRAAREGAALKKERLRKHSRKAIERQSKGSVSR